MNLDDETLLSAYLDDELDAPQRAEVEAALRSHPHLSHRLNDLTLARDLVAGLGRPAAPSDSSAAILSRLPGRPRRVRLARFPFALGAGASLAAGLAVAVTLAVQLWPGPRPRPAEAPATVRSAPATAAPAVATAPPPAAPPARPNGRLAERPRELDERLRRGEDRELAADLRSDGDRDKDAAASPPAAFSPEASLARPSEPGTPAPAPAPVAAAAAPAPTREMPALGEKAEAEGQDRPLAKLVDAVKKVKEAQVAPADREALFALLARPDVRRYTITVDVVDARAVEAVDGLVSQTLKTEPRWGELTVEQGVAIDPARPGQAVIFAMVLDGRERDRLGAVLRDRFPDVREDQPARAVVTQLADRAGTVACFKDEPVPGLQPIPEPFNHEARLAMKAGEPYFNRQEAPPATNAAAPGAAGQKGGEAFRDLGPRPEAYNNNTGQRGYPDKSPQVADFSAAGGNAAQGAGSRRAVPSTAQAQLSADARSGRVQAGPADRKLDRDLGRRDGVGQQRNALAQDFHARAPGGARGGAEARPPADTATVLVWLTPRQPDLKARP